MTKTRKITYGVLLAVTAALLVLGVFFDTAIDDKLFQPDNVMAKVMEYVGFFPPFVFVSSAFAVLFFLVKGEDKNRILKKTLLVAGAALSYFFFGFTGTETAFESILPRLLVSLGAAVLLTPLTFLVFRRKSEETLKRLSIFLIFASIVAIVSSLISINVLKYIWGRPRYREMIADGDYLLEAFTPWYKINGFTLHGHHSFPSGHTAAASNLLVLCALEEVFPDAERRKGTVVFLVAIYIVAMAYSRMILGAHFLSDVAGGFLIAFLTYAIARYVYFDKSRIVVEHLIKINSAAFAVGENATEEPLAEAGAAEAAEAEDGNEALSDEEAPIAAEEAQEEDATHIENP